MKYCKIIALTVCIALLFSLFGCKKAEEKEETVIPFEYAESSPKSETEKAEQKPADKQDEVSSQAQTVPPVTVEKEDTVEKPSSALDTTDTKNDVKDTSEDTQSTQSQRNDTQKTEEIYAEAGECTLTFEPYYTMDEVSYQTSDTFIGKILSCEEMIIDAKEISELRSNNGKINFYAYKTEVVKSYRSTFAKENTIVYVFSAVYPDIETWSVKYEAGQQYLMTVTPKIYKNKTNILFNTHCLEALLSPDVTLNPASYQTEKRLDKIEVSTLEQFENNPTVTKELSLPCFYSMHRVIVPADEKNTETKIIHPYKGSETQQEIDEMIKVVIDNTIANEKNEKIYSELGLLSEK